jgi:hypothetical protein
METNNTISYRINYLYCVKNSSAKTQEIGNNAHKLVRCDKITTTASYTA